MSRFRFSLPVALTLCLAASACSSSVQGSGGDGDDGSGGMSLGGGDGDGDASGDGDGDGDGDTASGGTSDSSGGSDGSGGAGTGGEQAGTGGDGPPPTVTCAGVEYPEPEVAGDFGCQDFDGAWPPTGAWTLTEASGGIDITTSPIVSSPNSVTLDVPDSGAADAKLTFENPSGADLLSVELLFQMNLVPFGAPLLWDLPMKFACARIGKVEGCLRYQRGEGYSMAVAHDDDVAGPTVCSFPGGPATSSWNDISVKLDSTGLLTVFVEANSEQTCQGSLVAVGTVATAWVGMESDVGDRSEYLASIDNVVVLVERE